MIQFNSSDPNQEDRQADFRTFLWFAGFMLAFLLVAIFSFQTEIERSGSEGPIKYVVLYETSSVVILTLLFPVVAGLVSRATPGQMPWRHWLAFHVIASIVVSAIHIGAMVLIRKLVFSWGWGETYIFTDNLARDFLYEHRKDAVTYALTVLFIVFGRQLDQQSRELAAAREQAKTTHRLTIKSGGRTMWLEADQVVWAKSAGNYVEIKTISQTFLARMTLKALEDQLRDAEVQAVRVHRSFVINQQKMIEAKPTGEGDLKIKMEDGESIPGSRRYRHQLVVA